MEGREEIPVSRLNNYCKQAHRQASPLFVVVVLVQYLGTVGGKIEELGERFTSKVRVRAVTSITMQRGSRLLWTLHLIEGTSS